MVQSAEPSRYHVAQYNIARLVAPLDEPRLSDFVANLDNINQLGDHTPGFVWCHQTEQGNSTPVHVRGDPMIIINLTVWGVDRASLRVSLSQRRRRVLPSSSRVVRSASEAHLVLWWIPAGHASSVEESEERLDYLRAHDPTQKAFTFKQRFPPPGEP